MWNPDLRGKELCSLSFSVENLYKLFRIPLHGRFVSSPTFIIVFNHLFISAWTHGYFILWVIIQHYFTYFIAQFVLALVIGSFQLALMSLCFDVPYLLWSFFELLFSGKARCSRLILYITCPSPTISTLSKESAWFCWRMILHPRFGRKICNSFIFLSVIVVQALSHVRLFGTPWTAAHQASLSFTNSGASSNSCPLSQWFHPTIVSSVIPFSSCLQSFPAAESFVMSWLSHQVAKVLELQLQP